jgi:hypothetical protein
MGKAKLMTKIKIENLNAGKFVLVLSIPLAVFYFFGFNRNAPDHIFYLIVNILGSAFLAIFTVVFLGMVLGIIYEIIKLCRPFFEWLFK